MALNYLSNRHLLIALVGCSPLCTLAASPSDGLPPPGLYQLEDSRTTVETLQNGRVERSREIHGDGATGSESIQWSRPGRGPVTQHVAGQGPATVCIPKHEARNPMAFLPTDGCVGEKAVTTPQGTTFTLHCSSGDFTGKMRRVDARTWEYEMHATMRATPSMAGGGTGGLERVMEYQARNAPTAKERKEAAEALVELRAARAESARATAEVQPQLDELPEEDASAVRKLRSVYRLTRIADNCSAETKR